MVDLYHSVTRSINKQHCCDFKGQSIIHSNYRFKTGRACVKSDCCIHVTEWKKIDSHNWARECPPWQLVRRWLGESYPLFSPTPTHQHPPTRQCHTTTQTVNTDPMSENRSDRMCLNKECNWSWLKNLCEVKNTEDHLWSEMMQDGENRITLNVGGIRFETCGCLSL